MVCNLLISLAYFINVKIFSQHEHPYISAQVNNGSEAYDHDSDGTHSQIAGCTVSLMSCLSLLGLTSGCLYSLTRQLRQ